MRVFEIERSTASGRVLVIGTFTELPIDKEIVCAYGGAEFTGIVETRFSGGAVVRLVHSLQPR